MTDTASTRRAGRRPATDSDAVGPPGRNISGLASFRRDTSDERAVAGLLFYKELDCLVDLAYRVSIDFFDRPHLYRDVTGDIVRDLAALRTRYGRQEDFLSRDQRHEIFDSVFGEGEGEAGLLPMGASPSSDSFAMLRDQLLAAAAAFAERVFNTSVDMLRAAARIMHVYLKDYLKDVTGASVQWSREVGLPAITERCYRILRDPQIAARFGVNSRPADDWPVAVDANGSKLVEQISGTPMREPAELILRGTFNDKQQLALRGAEALATVIDYDGDTDAERVDLLISKCYSWYAARGRVLRLPVALPATMTSAAALPALSPTSGSAVMDGNRGLYYGS